mmetsp:Transcript_6236/g.13719  ORF Transcript_6236/g.13719 Transcript_6236/m.13719 type:complete len:149 (+) Transcript_6236:58-504(+)
MCTTNQEIGSSSGREQNKPVNGSVIVVGSIIIDSIQSHLGQSQQQRQQVGVAPPSEIESTVSISCNLSISQKEQTRLRLELDFSLQNEPPETPYTCHKHCHRAVVSCIPTAPSISPCLCIKYSLQRHCPPTAIDTIFDGGKIIDRTIY